MLSPYSIVRNQELNAYTFFTKQGVEYRVAFHKTQGLYLASCPVISELVNEVSFEPVPSATRFSHDNRVSITIVDIIKTALQSGKIVIFVCDSTDNKETQRRRLFNNWFTKHGNGFEKYDDEIRTDECNYYCSLLFDPICHNKADIKNAFLRDIDEYGSFKNI